MCVKEYNNKIQVQKATFDIDTGANLNMEHLHVFKPLHILMLFEATRIRKQNITYCDI